MTNRTHLPNSSTACHIFAGLQSWLRSCWGSSRMPGAFDVSVRGFEVQWAKHVYRVSFWQDLGFHDRPEAVPSPKASEKPRAREQK